ncbi:MAG: hypothetical protein MZV65_28715 [Chromatiales bacterium]|nr:hypothetical protein [Chromatiales bacterium]
MNQAHGYKISLEAFVQEPTQTGQGIIQGGSVQQGQGKLVNTPGESIVIAGDLQDVIQLQLQLTIFSGAGRSGERPRETTSPQG